MAQQERIVCAEERMDVMREMILALEHTQENPIEVEDESDGETAVSDGVDVIGADPLVGLLVIKQL